MTPIPDSFWIIWLAGIILIWPAWFWFSIRSRKIRNEPIITRRPANARYFERFASGKTKGNIFANANNCLIVSVTDEELWITPFFPFNLIAPYGFMGLEYRLPKSIVRAELRPSFPFGRRIILTFANPENGKATTVILKLKDPEAFLAALEK